MIHLDCKTSYSFMRGYGSVDAWLNRAEQIGAPAICVADYCSTWGHIPFGSAGSNVKVLYGVTLPVVRSLEKDPRHALAVVIAKDDIKDLYDLVSLAHRQTYYRPRVAWHQIVERLEVILVAGTSHDISAFREFGRGFLGVPPAKNMLSYAAEEFECVPTVSPVYPSPGDKAGYDLVQNLSERQRIGETVAGGNHLLRRGEAEALYAAHGVKLKGEWWDNAEKIVQACNSQIPLATNIKMEGDLVALAKEGLEAKGLSGNEQYAGRLHSELEIIREKGFDDYFLFVTDLVNWAKERMYVGPGRGSVGGSVLAYVLGISSVDPIVHGTRFDRFIDVGRPDLPDIDIDFPDTRRDEVFEYLKQKYGEEKVARIGTLSLLGGKSAVNDIARAFGIDRADAGEFGRIVESHETLEDAVSSEQGQEVIKRCPYLAKSVLLDGVPRHTGKHAAGVCVTNEPATNFGSVDKSGVISLDLKMAEKVNLLKVDALGLKTLSVIEETCALAGISPYDLRLDDDPEVWGVFNRNSLTGIFQFEGRAVRQLTQQIKVDCFDDLCALTSLARPGPLLGGAADDWVQRRMGGEWDYTHSLLEPIVAETYGTLIYQEQVMAAVRDIANFDAIEVNAFRKAVGKKDPAALAGFRDKWLEGATASGMPRTVAESVWEEMCEFGGYAFNKSHAVAYSMLSYFTAWLKAKYPLEFACAQLNSGRGDDHSKSILRDIVDAGYFFNAFDPHHSLENWSIIERDGKRGLLGGFTGVNGVGASTAKSMLSHREKRPIGWMADLTPAQRDKILTAHNTPWHELSRMHEVYDGIYKKDQDAFKRWGLTWSKALVVEDIGAIEEGKGTHNFLGKLLRVQERDLNSEKYKQRRGGQEFSEATKFLNLFFEDDTGEIGCTISRWKYDKLEWIKNPEMIGRDFIIRGNIINDTGKWIFIEQIKELVDAQ